MVIIVMSVILLENFEKPLLYSLENFSTKVWEHVSLLCTKYILYIQSTKYILYYSIPLLPLCGGLGVDGGEGESSIITDDEGSSANIYKNRKKNLL